jgi:hypothetical protein
MLQGYGDTVLRAESLEKELKKGQEALLHAAVQARWCLRPVPQRGTRHAGEER